jgi:tetratricopeptide (TPR) repeat protein
MFRTKFLIIGLFLIGLTITGFECSSTELTSARLYIQQKNYPKALEVLHEEVTKNPKSDQGYYLMGNVYGELGVYDSMVTALNQSLAISNQYASNIKDLKRYYWAQVYNHGVAFFQKATNTKDKDSAAIDYEKSINSFKDAILIEPDSVDGYKNYAFVLMNQGKYDDAIEPLKTLIAKDSAIEGYKYLGEIYYDKASKLKSKYMETHNVEDSVQALDYFNQTISLLEQARKIYPNNGEILAMLSNSYVNADKTTEALDTFKSSVQQEPNNKYYRYNYGVVLLGTKDYKDAEEQFKKAIEIDPNYENANYNLAVTYVKWGADLAKEAIDKNDTGNTLYKDKYEAAIPLLKKVLETRSEDPSLWELLGRVYTALGQETQAKEAFNKADQYRK